MLSPCSSGRCLLTVRRDSRCYGCQQTGGTPLDVRDTAGINNGLASVMDTIPRYVSEAVVLLQTLLWGNANRSSPGPLPGPALGPRALPKILSVR